MKDWKSKKPPIWKASWISSEWTASEIAFQTAVTLRDQTKPLRGRILLRVKDSKVQSTRIWIKNMRFQNVRIRVNMALNL